MRRHWRSSPCAVAAVLAGLVAVACGGAEVSAPERPAGTELASTTAAVAPAAPPALVVGDGGSGIEAFRADVAASAEVDDLLASVQSLAGGASLTFTSVPEQAKDSVGVDATWLAITVPEAMRGRDVDIAAWRALLAAGVLRDVAADRGWPVPAGVTEALGEGGLGDGMSVTLEPGTADRPALAARTLPATVAEAEAAVREGLAALPAVELESLDFLSALSPVPVLRLRAEDPRSALPVLRTLQLGAGRFDFEGWWIELRDAAGDVVFIHYTARRMGSGGTYIEPSLERFYRGHG